MKNKVPSPAKGDLSSLPSADACNMLPHVLSPLETTAFQNHYKPFHYELEKGKLIYISHHSCQELLRSTTHKLDLFLNASIYGNRVPIKHREAFEDVKIILSLHPILRNKLCRLGCFTLLTIMTRGRTYFAEDQNFGKGHMQTIDALFARYNCAHVF